MSDDILYNSLEQIWTELRNIGSYDVSINGGEIEFHFQTENLNALSTQFSKLDLLTNKGVKFLSIKQKIEKIHLHLFKDIKAFFSALKSTPSLIDKNYVFIFDYENSFLFYDFVKKELFSNSKSYYTQYLLNHYFAYTELLKFFKENIPQVADFIKESQPENEIIIISKGSDNFLTNIKFKEIDFSIFGNIYERIPLEEINLRLINEEWLACFKSVICNYMELQKESQKTFATLYKNISYVYNQTNKNYQIFISGFSFDKVKKQFSIEKKSYFDSLNSTQDKISSQIISVPISVGASVYSFYQLSANFSIIFLIYLGIFIYSFFIMYAVFLYLGDINKLAGDVNEEEDNLNKHFKEISEEFSADFAYMKSKRKSIRFLGWAIIFALFITLIATGFYMWNFKQPVPPSNFKYILY